MGIRKTTITKPGAFTQAHLASRSGGNLQYPTGCTAEISGTAAGSGFSYCVNKGFSWPENGEYNWGGYHGDCNMCIFNYGYERGSHKPAGYPDRTGQVPYLSCASGAPSGARCSVKRIAYNGDPTSCCLAARGGGGKVGQTTGLPKGGQFSWDHVFEDTYTCDPNAMKPQDCNSASIFGNVSKICAKQDPKTRNEWAIGKGMCSAYMAGATAESGGSVLNTALKGYLDSGSPINSPEPETASHLSNLLQFCDAGVGSGSCDAMLQQMCNGFSRSDVQKAYSDFIASPTGGDPKNPNYSKMTSIDLANLNLFKACACHLPIKDYVDWAKVGVDEINVACDPLCQLGGISQYINDASVLKPAVCNQNLCIIDNVSIDQIDSTIEGGVNFNVVCGSCGESAKNEGSSGATCRCIFSNINVFEKNSTVLDTLNFNQNCGGNCQMPDPDEAGKFIQINCDTGKPFDVKPNGNKTPDTPSSFQARAVKWLKDNRNEVILFTVMFLIIIFFIGWWLLTRDNSSPQEEENNYRYDDYQRSDYDQYG